MRIADLVSGVREHRPGSPSFTDCARALAETAFCSDSDRAAAATKALFSELVEEWADGFEPSLCATYAAFMSEVLYAPGSPVASVLGTLGYGEPEELLDRYRRITSARSAAGLDRRSVKKVAVLSRITLGADVAVTRPLLLAAASAFPAAEVEFIGPKKNADLTVAGHPIRHCEISYGRTALLVDRLLAWNHLREAVQNSVAGLRPDEYLIIDPDSRLTQLGLLPVVPDSSYHFFESRSAGGRGSCSLGSLALQWCGRAWGVDAAGAGRVPPQIPPASCKLLSDKADRPLAAVSFGVGGRASKRVGDHFEDSLLDLLRRRGVRIVLDYGLGEDEARVVDQRVAAFAGTVGELSDDQPGWPSQTDLLTWRGSLAAFGAWTAAADVYVGYDSAAAHLAAAHATPVIEVFAGAPSERFRDRWTPSGPAPVHVLPFTGSADVAALLRKVDRIAAETGLSKPRARLAE
ncbi:MAG: hypothetical protein OXJ37_11620 [Bryobacterales bacterium]|nr:hypothetical protein [Bryobacterales bacterium]